MRIISFEPEIKGSNNWVDDYTIEFIPDELLVSEPNLGIFRYK